MTIKLCPTGVCGVLPDDWNYCQFHGLKLLVVEPGEYNPERSYQLPYNVLKEVTCPCGYTFQFHQRPQFCPSCGHGVKFLLFAEGPEHEPHLL